MGLCDGKPSFSGDKDITSITTCELRDYLSVLDDNRDMEGTSSQKQTRYLA